MTKGINIPAVRWPVTRVDRVASVNARIGWKALTAAEYQSDGYVFLATPNIKEREIDFENVNYISEYRYDESPDLKLAVGDVLLAKDGNTLGVANVIRRLPRPATVNGSIAVLRPFGIEPRFLRYVLASTLTQDLIGELKNGMGVPHLFQWDIKRLPVPLPAPKCQQWIADYLDGETQLIDALIGKRRQMIDRLTERCMSVMSAGVSGRLTNQGVAQSALPWLETRGSTWHEVKLTLIARLGSGHTPSRGHPEWWQDCSIPWITTGEVAQMRSDRIEFIHETREKVSELGVANSAAEVHRAGTVVLCRTASAGYSAIMGENMATSQDFATWTCGPLLRPRFLLLCLRVMRRDLLGRLAMGSTHKTIYMPDIQALRVPLPPVPEQDVIVDVVWGKLRHVHRLIDLLQQQVELLAERRQALITAAVNGGIDVPGLAA